MRITHGMLSDTTLRNLNYNMERLDRLQTQITSGKRISSPSDDPIGAAAAIEFRVTLAEIDQFIKNVDAGYSWLQATDSALDSVGQILHRARELAVQGASDTLTGSERQRIADEVEQLLQTGIQLGNATYAGQYLFAGFKTTTPPFEPMGAPPVFIVYRGDSQQIMRQVDSASYVPVNVTGDGAIRQALTTLIGLRDALNIGDSSTVSGLIAQLDSAAEAVMAERSEVGARMNRLSNQKDVLEDLKVNVSDLLSKTEDVDLTEAITEYAMQQNVYQAALGAGAKALQPSLLDYLVR